MPSHLTPQELPPSQLARYYERAIKTENDHTAMIELAIMMLNRGTGIKRDPERAVQLLERAIKQANSSRAMHNLGLYLDDTGNRSQRRRGIELLERAACMSEDQQYLYGLATALTNGRCGIKRQPERAERLLRRALRLGEHVKCMWLLASILVHEPSVPADTAYAIRLCKKVIEITNDADKMNSLGLLFAEPTSRIPVNKRRAMKWFERAVKTSEHMSAKFNLAVMLTSCEDKVDPDPVRAVRLLKEVVVSTADKDVILQLASVLRKWEAVEDQVFAAALYDYAVRKFDCIEAMIRLGVKLLCFFPPSLTTIRRAMALLERHYELEKSPRCLAIQIVLLCHGAPGVPIDTTRARELLDLYRAVNPDSGLMARLLRCGVRDVIERNRPLAFELLQSQEGGLSASKLLHSTLIGEEGCNEEEKSLVNYEAAAELLESALNDEDNSYVWAPFYLRSSAIGLPVQGDPDRLTMCSKRHGRVDDLVRLNLGSLLLEQRGLREDESEKGEELLRSILSRGGGGMAAMNLGYVLWHGLGGVQKDRLQGAEMFQLGFERCRDGLSGALLAGAIAEGWDHVDPNIENAAVLWRHVEASCRMEGADEREYERVCEVVPGAVVRKIELAARELDETHGEYTLDEGDETGGIGLGLEDINEIVSLHGKGQVSLAYPSL